MGKMRRKGWSGIIIALLLVAIITGCSGGNNSTGQNVNKAGDGGGSSAPKAGEEAPKEVGYPDSLTYWVGMNGNAAAVMKNYNEIAAYQETEKITGTKVEFQHPPQGQAKDAFNLLISSGKLPDVIEYTWASVPKGPDKAIEDGTIIRLNELIEQYAPNLTKVLEENPEYRKLITTDDGNIYVFPFLRGDEYLLTYNGLAIRQDWLDNLKQPMPETIDEWHTVLTAIKTGDPNQNGKQDEIPLFLDIGYNTEIDHAFIGAWGITNSFYQIDGKVQYGPIQPEFKEYIATMRQWYEEGLIDPDYAATDGKLKDAKVTGNQLAALQTYTGSGIGRYTSLMEAEHPEFQLVGAPNVVLNKGDMPILGQKDSPFLGSGAAVTTSNKNPEETVRWLDFKFSEEGHMLFNFGIEGESYEMKDGYPTYTDKVMKHPELPVTQAMSKYNMASFSGPFVQDRRYMEQYAALPAQKEAINTWMNAKNDRLMPVLSPTADESAKYASIMNDVKTFYSEMVNKFIMGVEPMSSFDNFVETIKGMGIEEAIAIQQAGLDRFNSR